MANTEWSFASGVLERPPESAPPPAAEGPEVPRRIGPFEVEAELGRGGMAQVFRVRYRGHPFALKLLINEAPGVRERLDREAKLVGSLQHPGIVSLQGAGTIEGRAFLLYELIPDARPLSTAWGSMPVEQRLELIVQIADAVGFAHSRGIVHRDLKPDNVLVDRQGQPRVIDFGLARQAGMERLTVSGVQLGTQAYMAPEQFATDADLQRPAIDVWALGVLLYEALTERMPYPAEKVSELRGKLEEAPPSPREVNPWVSRALETVCFRALSSGQDQRQADGSVFARELRAAVIQGPDPGAFGGRRLLAFAAFGGVAAALGLGLWGGGAAPASGRPPARVEDASLERPFARLEAGAVSPQALLDQAEARLARVPGDVQARLAEGAAWIKLGKPERGLEIGEAVLAERPRDVGGLHLLAAAHFHARRYEEAGRACELARTVDPEAEFSYLYPTLIACNQGDYARCIRLADEALARSGESASLWAARGTARAALNQLAPALEDLSSALARAENPTVRLNRADVYVRMARFAEALEDLEAVQGGLRSSRGWLSVRIQCLLVLDRARAVKEARAFQLDYPDSSDANFYLGEALRRQAQAQEARKYLQRAVEVEPGSAWAQAAQRVLQDMQR